MDIAGRVALRFTGGPHDGGHVNLTAVRADGAHLWVAGDESATLERLVLDSTTVPTRAGRQRSFRLADLVQLPGPPTGESDVQGIARADGWLWVIGSHGLVRRRPKPEHDEDKRVRRLAKLRRDPNRFVIARLAVQFGVDRRPEPVRVARDGRRSAVVGAPGAETLVDLLHADPHLGPFLAIPARDNGFDVQGVAAVGDRLFVGLRGPVLRGWAVVLEVRPVQDPTDPGRLALGIFPEGGRCRKHFLDLGGLGVRDLCPDGDDLLVLAGPTMALPGSVRVHRWRGAALGDALVPDTELPVELDVPHGDLDDHPAALTLLADATAPLLVVYDVPAPDRRPEPDTVLADRLRTGPDVRRNGAAPGEAPVADGRWAELAPEPTTAAPRPAERPAAVGAAEAPATEPPAAETPAAETPTAETPATEAFPAPADEAPAAPTSAAPTSAAPTSAAPATAETPSAAAPAGEPPAPAAESGPAAPTAAADAEAPPAEAPTGPAGAESPPAATAPDADPPAPAAEDAPEAPAQDAAGEDTAGEEATVEAAAEGPDPAQPATPAPATPAPATVTPTPAPATPADPAAAPATAPDPATAPASAAPDRAAAVDAAAEDHPAEEHPAEDHPAEDHRDLVAHHLGHLADDLLHTPTPPRPGPGA